MKDKKKLLVAVLVLLICVIALIAINFGKKNNKNVTEKATTNSEITETTTASGETVPEQASSDNAEVSTEGEDATTLEDLALPGEETTTKKNDKKNDKKNNKDKEDETTNYWDTVEVIEETQVNNSENVSEEYPGQNAGWSPIVSPEELE